ncbi:permease prefix domain 1-containing protein [Saccharopolyspora sp. WRP15-2]|uniref:Permease prefix domain 1-containing protein n=1 Tax=Saccharopolyspora oryzae TaxID=2997343 RepID=A0ABT4UTA6_9PSEU|nr:permease prefix domain 1-containing protein [Saccharopolyspora oryzae]MDA3624904.1 permease prefix domain 1-containing protein [Saccharopolyspora oryzae]
MSDRVEQYVAELSAALRGPARVKSRMVDEIRDGLADTIDAQTSCGVPHEQAVDRALREFGTVDEIAPSCQQELTIAQTRQTSTNLVIVVGFLITAGHLTWTTEDWELPTTAQLMLAVATTAAALAVGALAATGVLTRWVPVPEGLPMLVSWACGTASVAMPFAAVVLALTAPLHIAWPLIAVSYVIAIGSHVVLALSARACRECVRRTELETSS